MKKELLEAQEIARDILDGKTDSNDGCSQIGEINRELDWPDELSAFGLLAHEQYDHENIGITAESCKDEILAEARKLVEIEL